jgi:predicted dehydrogenase
MRAGIIGCGGIARAHVKGYEANGVEVTALMDVSEQALASMAAGVEGAKCFNRHESLLDSGLVDLVSICTPPVAHEAPAVLALARNIHVLLEKPLAHSVASARRIVAAAEQSDALLMTAFRHRYLPAIIKMREIIEAGEIGTAVYFHNTFCGPAFAMVDKWFSKRAIAGGGTLMDTSIHSVDIFRYLFGEVVEQKAIMQQHLEGTDVEDASILTLKSRNGVIGALTASWVAADGVSGIDVMGQEGRVAYDYHCPDQIKLRRHGNDEWEIVPVETSSGFDKEIAHFLRAIQGQETLSCTGEDGLKAVEIIQSTYMEE